MPLLSSQKQQPVFIALIVIILLIGGILYKHYFQQAPETAVSSPPFSLAPSVQIPQLPQDLFRNNEFLKLQTYQPVVAPEPSARPNPFAAP